jgi:hypothetical protein
MKDLNTLDVPRSFTPILGDARSPEELVKATGCTLDEAQYIFELSTRCETYKNSDLQLSKNMSTKRRFLRGKPDTRAHLTDKRTSVAGLPPKTTISLGEEAQGASTVELRKLLGASTSKTAAPLPAEQSAAASVSQATEAPPSPEEVKARNRQTVRPTGTTMTPFGGKAKGWGNNTVVVGMDAEVQRKKLAQLREEKTQALKADPTRLTKGPAIGRASDFVPLSQLVEAKTPWLQLSPAVKAAMRNLQLTQNILESWYSGQNRIYSSLQAKTWDDLTEIQRKSASLLGLEGPNWNALASVLSTSVRAQQELRKSPTKHNVNNVAMKSGA